MPIYEYTCQNCKRKFKKLVGMVAVTTPLQCPRCQSPDVNRLISRFARVRTEDAALDALGDEMEAMGENDDPKAMRRMMREMGREMGEDLEQDFDAMLDERSKRRPRSRLRGRILKQRVFLVSMVRLSRPKRKSADCILPISFISDLRVQTGVKAQ